MRSLRPQIASLLTGLVVQYALGMYVNLYVSFPEGAVTDAERWGFVWSHWPVGAHVVIAVLLLIGAIIFAVRAYLRRNRGVIVVALLGLAGILWAGVSGAIFVSSQTDAYSYSMSFGFLLAVFAYGWAFASSRQAQPVW